MTAEPPSVAPEVVAGNARGVAAVIATALAEGDGGPQPFDRGGHRTAQRVAATIGRLITAEAIPVGTRLPTVRELAAALDISPTTVSEAWRSLAATGAIVTRGRNGTVVSEPTSPTAPRRYRRVTEGPGHFAVDLSTGTPDPALLPDLGPALARVNRQSLTSSYLDRPVLPALEEALRDDWPFAPEAITVVDGALDALDRVSAATLRLGDRVIIEHPTFPPLLDLLEQLGCDVIGVDLDDEGPVLDQVVAAFSTAIVPAAMFVQPRAHNPTGVGISTRRARSLADVLRPHPTLVIEDDHANAISTTPLVSLGHWLPERTIHIRSFSKSHGPDLRLAAIGGAGDVVTAVASRRRLGPGWSSRILQALLVELLADPQTDDVLAAAATVYAERRRAVDDVLGAAGVATTGSDGINLWMTVDHEQSALVSLAARGIGAAPGAPFMVRPDDDHLRVTVGLLDPALMDVASIADQLATAAQEHTRRRRPTAHR